MVYIANVIHKPMRYKIIFIVFYMTSSVAGCIYGCLSAYQDSRRIHDVYMLINRTLEFSMQVSVLLHMMRYFTEYIVNVKKKLVRRYITGCIIAFCLYFSFYIIELFIETHPDLFVITETMYVITNIIISLLCLMSCKHIIYKLKNLFNDVCCSMRLEVARNVAILVTNTGILVIVLVCRILVSLYFLLSKNSTKKLMDASVLYLPIFFNCILLFIVNDYSAKSRFSQFFTKLRFIPVFNHIPIPTDLTRLIDNKMYARGCECSFSNPTCETTLKYHYDETLSSKSVNQSSSSLRSLFTANSKNQQSSSQQNNRDSAEIEEVQSDEEDNVNDLLLPSVEESNGMGSRMREEIEKQVSDRNQSQEKKKKGSLKVEDRCGKPLPCTVSLAVYIELPAESSYFTKWNNLYVRCSYCYEDENLTSPEEYHSCGETEFIPVSTCINGFMFNCCIPVPIPMNLSDASSTTPTARLQEFLTKHSTILTTSHLITDIYLCFECIGTNSTSSLNYTGDKNNHVLFSETMSLNILLNSQNALLLRNNSVCKLSPRLTRVSHINPKHMEDTNTKCTHNAPRERRFSNFSDLYYSDHHSPSHTPHDSPITEDNQDLLSTSPKEKLASSTLDRLDLDMIPDFPSSSVATDRVASCPNSVQITPNHYVELTKNQFKTPDTQAHFFNEDEEPSFVSFSSTQYELPEGIPDMSLYILFLLYDS